MSVQNHQILTVEEELARALKLSRKTLKIEKQLELEKKTKELQELRQYNTDMRAQLEERKKVSTLTTKDPKLLVPKREIVPSVSKIMIDPST
jgi:hypothetical protein